MAHLKPKPLNREVEGALSGSARLAAEQPIFVAYETRICQPAGAGGPEVKQMVVSYETGIQGTELSGKRVYDLFFAGAGLVLLGPLFLVIALLVKLSDRGAVFYRQTRIGRHGRPFRICKFRTMSPGADRIGPSVTRDGDARITRIGRVLRKTKLDELPQLWNVLKGEMSLVGPRPEVPRYVQHYKAEDRAILNYKPGITDLASIYFRGEETLLEHADNLEKFYVEQCLPRKLLLNRSYAERATLLTDTWIIVQTVCPYWIGVLAVYGMVLVASFCLSYWLVLDFSFPAISLRQFEQQMLGVVTVQLACLIWRNQCKGLLSYFSVPELRQVGAALGLACLIELGLWWAANLQWPPRHVILVDLVFSFLAVAGLRLLLRLWRERSADEIISPAHSPARVAIIGAGSTGAQLAREMMRGRKLGRTVVAFFDDDFKKWQKQIHEIPVIGMPECLLEGWGGKLDEVVIAMPEASAERIRQIDQLLRKTSLKSYTAFSPLGFERENKGAG